MFQTMEQVEGKSVDIPTGLFVKTEGDPIGMETSGILTHFKASTICTEFNSV